jgi:predicted AlkP superfamily pyrophosphatase or phosphodiesterase
MKFCKQVCGLLLSLLLLVPLWAQTRRAESGARRPKLVVVVAVDQMRADYIERYGHQWTSGLKRLIERGAWFRRAAYTYWNTVTCAGHSTIGTGAEPATHGMVQNAWWDSSQGRNVACTEDPKVRNVGGRVNPRSGESPWAMMVPTLADEMRVQLPAPTRVVSLSLKARSAIGLAGHRADAVVWFDGGWQTSDSYANELPGFVTKFAQARPADEERRKPWTRAMPESAYLFDDNGAGERPGANESVTFPHAVNSPAGDEALTELARAAVETYGLGRNAGTDFLGISYSVLDDVGHRFGPRSHEVQDVLVRLDAQLGVLLAFLDKAVGAENYVLALSSDHGVAPIPEQMQAAGMEAGRIASRDVIVRVEQALAPHLGPGPHVARYNYTELYFRPGIYAKLQEMPDAMRAVQEAILSVPGMWRVYRSEELPALRGSADRVAHAAAMSYYPGRSGELIVLARPYWFAAEAAATHGSGHGYDQRVPVIFYGAGIQPGEYMSAAGPQDIAPTLAHLISVTLARADGRVLTEALAPRAEKSTAPARKR